ncbi:MAG TPA: hypothetical protein VHM24_13565, partial [Gemmatimonadaceae bacterium]|nr:hypothetical protein [Gemmatimonadaceae bacterium]
MIQPLTKEKQMQQAGRFCSGRFQESRPVKGSRRKGWMLRAMAVALISIGPLAACRQDVTVNGDERVTSVSPAERNDTSFVGDTVVYSTPTFSGDQCDVQGILCGSIGGFNVRYTSSNPSVAAKLGFQVVSIVAAG